MNFRVATDVTKPLWRRCKVRKSTSDWVWVSFTYERLPTFYFYYRRMGHGDRFFRIRFVEKDESPVMAYGVWIKARTLCETQQGSQWLVNDDGKGSTEKSRGNGRDRMAIDGKGEDNGVETKGNSVHVGDNIGGGETKESNEENMTDNVDNGIVILDLKRRRREKGQSSGHGGPEEHRLEEKV